MKLRSLILAFGLILATQVPKSAASAALITGSFSISGSVTYDTLDLTGGAGLNFNFVLPPPIAPIGLFMQVTKATGYFAALGMAPFATTGEILNIASINPPPPDYAYAQSGVPILVTEFLNHFETTGASIPGLHFDLTSIPMQGGTPCPAAPVCVEGPFLFTQTGTGVQISFDVRGRFINGPDAGDYVGSFSIFVTGLTIAEAANRVLITRQDLSCGVGNVEHPCAFTASFEPIPTVLGDVNSDGHVDCADLGIVKAAFGKRNGQFGYDSNADVNHNGFVDISDLALVARQQTLGTVCK